MSDAVRAARTSNAVRNYMLFSFAGLLAMVPILLMKGMDLWCIFPLVLGALALMAHWRGGPVFVLISLAIILYLRTIGLDPISAVEVFVNFVTQARALSSRLSSLPPSPVLDFLLGLSVLAYVAGHYRLQAFIHHAVPPDPRSPLPGGRVKGQPQPERENPRRSPDSLTNWEIPRLGIAALVSVAAAVLATNIYRSVPSPVGPWLGGWAMVTFVWSSATLLLLAWAVFGYLARNRMTRTESLLYLQDQLWRQTRREQSRISRWIAWARLSYQRLKEEL